MRRKLSGFRASLYFALVLSFVLLSGCKTQQDASAAAKQLDATASQLCTYYDDLSKQLDQTVQLNELLQAIYGIPFDSAARQQILDAKAEIVKRSAIAHSLDNLADAYGKLAGSSAGGDASKAASSLATELQSVKALPKGDSIPDGVGEAAKLLISYAQSQSLKEGAVAVSKAVGAVSDIFDREEKAYESINSTRLAVAAQVAINLVQNHDVDIKYSDLVEPALKPFSLNPKSQDISSDPKYITLVKNDIQFQVDDQTRQYADTTDQLSSRLHSARESLDRIAKGK